MKRVFTQTFGVVGAILQREGKFLLVREAPRGLPDDDKWNFPAGWLDVGEDPLEAVKREVKEESGFDFKPTAVLGVYSLVRKDVKVYFKEVPHGIKLTYIGEISESQSRLADDVTEAKWYTPEEIYVMDSKTLRDLDIKQMVKDYLTGKKYPLDLIKHTVVEE